MPTYHPLTTCVDKEGRLKYDSWTKTLMPGGARGLALKSKFPLMSTWAERIGFVREYQIRLRVITAWGMRRYHYWERKLGSQEASPAQR